MVALLGSAALLIWMATPFVQSLACVSLPLGFSPPLPARLFPFPCLFYGFIFRV